MESLSATSIYPANIAYLDSLPDEITLLVCSFLSPLEVRKSFAPISKRFYVLAQDPVLWRIFCENQGIYVRCAEGEQVDYYWHYWTEMQKRHWNYVEGIFTEKPCYAFAGNFICYLENNLIKVFDPIAKKNVHSFHLQGQSFVQFKKINKEWRSFTFLLESSGNPAHMSFLINELLSQALEMRFLTLFEELQMLKMSTTREIFIFHKKAIDDLLISYMDCIFQKNVNVKIKCEVSAQYVVCDLSNFVYVWSRDTEACRAILNADVISFGLLKGELYLFEERNRRHPFRQESILDIENLKKIHQTDLNGFILPLGLKLINPDLHIGYRNNNISIFSDTIINPFKVLNPIRQLITIVDICIDPSQSQIAIITERATRRVTYSLSIFRLTSDWNCSDSPEFELKLKHTPYSIEWKHGYIWLNDSHTYSRISVREDITLGKKELLIEDLIQKDGNIHPMCEFHWIEHQLFIFNPKKSTELKFYDFGARTLNFTPSTEQENDAIEPAQKKARFNEEVK